MADPFYEPLPALGQVPWSVEGVVQEIRNRIAALDDTVSPEAIQGAITEAAAVLNPTALTDSFISDKVGQSGSFTDQSLKALYPVYRVWSGSSYPARIAGAVNIFLGPSSPGVAMGPGDYWANPNLTTNDTVASQITNPSSSIYAALQQLNRNFAEIALTPLTTPATFSSSAGGEVYGWEAPSGVFTEFGGQVVIPLNWNTARVRIDYFVPSGATGDIRLSRTASTYSSGQPITVEARVTNTVTAPPAGRASSALITNEFSLTGKTRAAIAVSRVGSSDSDTMTSTIRILGARLERVS